MLPTIYSNFCPWSLEEIWKAYLQVLPENFQQLQWHSEPQFPHLSNEGINWLRDLQASPNTFLLEILAACRWPFWKLKLQRTIRELAKIIETNTLSSEIKYYICEVVMLFKRVPLVSLMYWSSDQTFEKLCDRRKSPSFK